MDEDLENFIRERKARVAFDRANLERDPPYMELKVRPRRVYGSTVKENIPPRFAAQRKDESSSVGLPLGVEYEKKKQRLQHELRMDFRRHMGQSSELQRNAAMLAEDRGSHRAPCLSEEDEEPEPLLLRHRDLPGWPLQRGSGEEEELQHTEGRRLWLQEADATYSQAAGSRDKKKNLVGVGRECCRSRTLSKNEDVEFITGLLIGSADSDEALQRKKERYRKELQEQIAEQLRNKKREKDLELKVAATGANDPEKKPGRIRQFGLRRRNGTLVLEPTKGSVSSAKTFPYQKHTGREGEMPTEEPHVAFQSPLLEYSSALGLGDSSLSQPIAPFVQSTMDLPRNPMFLPHPPSSLSEPYRSPFEERSQIYESRNLLDPNQAPYAHHNVPGSGFPVSYWDVPSGRSVPSQLGTHSPHSQHSASSLQPSNNIAAVDSQTRVRPRSTRDRILSYKDALKQQIQEQQELRRLEREERERYEVQLEADLKNHQPWGRGGGGAPLRDSCGNLIADLNQMHKQNEEAYSNPEVRQRRTARTSCRGERPDHTEEGSPGAVPEYLMDRIPGFTHVQTPQFARGNIFSSQPTKHQLQEQDKYKAYLKQQIEEKMQKKAEERERHRLEEEREEKRLAEQRARIQKEFEEEQERKKRKEMEQKAKNEELVQLAEKKKNEAERKQKEAEEKETAALRRQYERERQARVEEVYREPSPPIPTLQRKRGQRQQLPTSPSVNSQPSTAPVFERSSSGIQSPPVPACRNQLRAAGNHHDVFSELSALRWQLRSEQKRVERHLQQGDWEELDSPISMRHQLHPAINVFDMARLRLQAPVRRPNSRNTEPRNPLHAHNFLQLKSNGNTQSDYLNRFPPQQDDYLRKISGSSRRGFLLESESAFMDPLGDASPVPQTPELERIHQLSARERRRLAKQSQHHSQDRAFSSSSNGPGGTRCVSSGDQLEFEPGTEGKSRYVTGALDVAKDSSTKIPSPSLNHESSVESDVADHWRRSGSSDTLQHFNPPQRRE